MIEAKEANDRGFINVKTAADYYRRKKLFELNCL